MLKAAHLKPSFILEKDLTMQPPNWFLIPEKQKFKAVHLNIFVKRNMK